MMIKYLFSVAAIFAALNSGLRAEDATMTDMNPDASTVQPFAAGDVFVGATVLNNPDDDHAGRGRILQFDADLNLKGVLWTEGTTHLVGGISFAPDGTLWAFDSFAWAVVRVSPEGTQLPVKKFADRPFGSVQFLDDGQFALVEYLKGSAQPENLTTRYPYLPDDPESVGHGEVHVFDANESLIRTFAPDVDGGMSGSMGATHTTLGSDGHTLIYTSETGPRLMQYDLKAAQQLPDLMTLPPSQGGPPAMMFDVERMGDKLVLPLGTKLTVMTESAEVITEVPLPGFGWALVAPGHDHTYAYAANWFTGDVVKVSLKDGKVLASVTIAPNTLSGLAQFHG